MANGDWEPSTLIRNVAFVIRELGVPTFVLLFLLGQSAGYVPSETKDDHKEIKELLRRGVAKTEEHDAKSHDASSDANRSLKILEHYLEGICYNNAQTVEEKQRCQRPRPSP